MKILTKEWAEEYSQLRFIFTLKEIDEKKDGYEILKKMSREEFFNELKYDNKLLEVILKNNLMEKFYFSRIDRNKKILRSLPERVYNKIKNVNFLVLGYATNDDKVLLTSYANTLRKKLEAISKRASDITEKTQGYLPKEFDLDEVVGELVFEEYVRENDYCINIGGRILRIENYRVIERENYKINEWEEDNPLSLWTSLYSAELHYTNNGFYELHLLMVDGDEYENTKLWYFTLGGTNIYYEFSGSSCFKN